jgi:prophage regulatory protein
MYPERFTFNRGSANVADKVPMAPRILRRKQVEARTGLSRTTIYELVRANQFPRQVRVSPGAVGWLESEIDAYLLAQIERSRTIA